MCTRAIKKIQNISGSCFETSRPTSFPILSEEGKPLPTSGWRYYSGDLNALNVIIQSKNDATALYLKGTFGVWLKSKQTIEQDDKKAGSSPDEDDLVLALTLEEAFFLSFALGCLFVQSDSRNLDLEEQWKLFSKIKSDFPSSYATYHHFRAKGWVPKDGLKYGVDYVLYKQGPSYFHAEYGVVIQPMDNTETDQRLTWSKVAGLGRLVSSVSKTLLFCHVSLPKSTDSPNCLKDTSVGMVTFSRWASPKEREDEKDIDLTF